MNDILTPLQALEALLAQCELTLDYRPDFRLAMSNAHTAIHLATNPPTDHEPGESIDDDVSWADLFGEPDPSAFNPQVLAVARGMAQPLEVAHG